MNWHDWLIFTFLMLIAPKIWDEWRARLVADLRKELEAVKNEILDELFTLQK